MLFIYKIIFDSYTAGTAVKNNLWEKKRRNSKGDSTPNFKPMYDIGSRKAPYSRRELEYFAVTLQYSRAGVAKMTGRDVDKSSGMPDTEGTDEDTH